jgi:hypothetical protein
MVCGVRRARVAMVVGFGVLAFAVPASASAARLTLKVQGLTRSNSGSPAGQIGQHAKLVVGANGKLPAGTKLRLASRTNNSLSFKLAPGTIKLHHGSATLEVTHYAAATVAYELAAVNKHGKVVAGSGITSIIWILPPRHLVVSDDKLLITLDMQAGGISGCKTMVGPTTCEDTVGAAAGAMEPLSGYTLEDRLAGTKVTLSFNNQQVCSTTAYAGQCSDIEETMPPLDVGSYIPVTTTYTNLTGKTFSVTLEIFDHA